MKRLDQFALPVNLNFSDEGINTGAILTCIILLLTLVFTRIRYRILVEREGTLFTSTILKKENDKSRVFTQEDGFQIAFAVVDDSTKDYSDRAGRLLSEYLEVTVSQSYYDSYSNENAYTSTPLKTHPCTEAELGLDNAGNSKFYPIIEEDREDLMKAKPFFMCFDHS